MGLDMEVAKPYHFYLDVEPWGPSESDHIGTLLYKDGKVKPELDVLFNNLDPQSRNDERENFERLIDAAYDHL